MCVRWRVAGAEGAIGRACLEAVGGPDRPTQEAKRVGRRVRAGAALWGYKKGHARGLAPSGRRERDNTHLYPCAGSHPTGATVPALTRAHYRDKDKTKFMAVTGAFSGNDATAESPAAPTTA